MNNKKLMILLTCLQLAMVPFAVAMKDGEKTDKRALIEVVVQRDDQNGEETKKITPPNALKKAFFALISSAKEYSAKESSAKESSAKESSAKESSDSFFGNLSFKKLTYGLAQGMTLAYCGWATAYPYSAFSFKPVPMFALSAALICLIDGVLYYKKMPGRMQYRGKKLKAE